MMRRQFTTPLVLGLILVVSGCARKVPDSLVLDETVDEGQSSYRIATPSATWVFHKQGAGFSSLLDSLGRDWINYHPEGGPAGHYRGIPNAVFNMNKGKDNFFHPGHEQERASSTTLVHESKDRVVLRSKSGNGRWVGKWEILADRATFTMETVPTDGSNAYWILYEGTPGGRFDNEDLCLRSDGTLTPLSEKWEDSMENIAWVAFISESAGSCLVMISHQSAPYPLSYWPMQESMTVFGFGRALGPPDCQLTEPLSFTVALIGETDPARIAEQVAGLIN